MIQRTRRLADASLAVAFILAAGCQSVESITADAREGSSESRRAALDDQVHEVRSLLGEGPDVTDDRETVNRFLIEAFQSEQGQESGSDPVIRARLLGIALQGQFPCAPALVALGARDPSPMVRQAAVQGMDEAPPENVRTLLTDLLLNDEDFVVRLEAAKAFRDVGSDDWAEPLVRVILNGTEDESLRYQAHLSARKLIGEDIPFTPTDWSGWLAGNE